MGTLLTEDELVKALVPYFQGEILQSRKDFEDFLARSVEIIVKAQLRKVVAELEALEPESMRQGGPGNYANRAFSESILTWLEAAKKEVDSIHELH